MRRRLQRAESSGGWRFLAGWSIEDALSNIEGMDMLVLSRKKNESIVINNDITIVVVEIRGDKVRLGVEAPKEVPVHRREVYDAIRRNEAAESDKAARQPDANGTAGEV
jgi:carbon storage regulator